MLALLLIINGYQQPLHSFTYDQHAHRAMVNGIEIPAGAISALRYIGGTLHVDHDVVFRGTFEARP